MFFGGCAAARAVFKLHFPVGHLHAALSEGNNQQPSLRVVAHRLPAVPALHAGTHLGGPPQLLFDDVRPIRKLPGLWIDPAEDVLINGFVLGEKLSGLAVQLPQNAGLPDGEKRP